MAYTTIPKSTDYFDVKLYTGNGSTQTISGLNFQPDFTWIKSRSNATEHSQFDSVRGATKMIASSTFEQEQTVATMLTAWTSDGFSLGSYSSVNGSGYSQASWNWKANGTGSANTTGSINSTVSANTTSGFSIVTYTGTGANATVGHGLGVVPKIIIVKCLSATETDWGVYHASLGNTKNLRLNRSDAVATSSAFWNDTTPTSTVFSLGANGNQNGNGGTYVAYCFASIKGFSKIGSYIGNGEASDNAFIYCGFKPKYILHKAVDAAENWLLWDSPRNAAVNSNGNPTQVIFEPNGAGGENNTTARSIDLVSNGFKIRGNNANFGGSGAEYAFIAFADEPLVSTNGIPATAR